MNDKKLNLDDLAEEIGVGRSTITAVRKMLGVGSKVRKMFAKPVRDFLKKYPDFIIADASDMKKFKKRHPGFQIPG